MSALVNFALDSSRVDRIQDLPQKKASLLVEELVRTAEQTRICLFEMQSIIADQRARITFLESEYRAQSQSLKDELSGEILELKRSQISKSELYVSVLLAISMIVAVVLGVKQILGE